VHKLTALFFRKTRPLKSTNFVLDISQGINFDIPKVARHVFPAGNFRATTNQKKHKIRRLVTVNITAHPEYSTGAETWVEITINGVEAGVATDNAKRDIIAKSCKAFASGRREPRGSANDKEELRFWLTIEGRNLTEADVQIVDGLFYEAVYLTQPARCTACNLRGVKPTK
jgi:hypothetical protein